MGEKDISEKILADYNDVFADVVNVLLFHGERLIKEEELMPYYHDYGINVFDIAFCQKNRLICFKAILESLRITCDRKGQKEVIHRMI